MNAEALFWGDVSPTSHEIESNAMAALQRGELVPALLLEERGEAHDALVGALSKEARKAEKSLLVVAQAIELVSIYSEQAAVAIDGNRKSTLHLLETPAASSDVLRQDETTACGEKHRKMFSVMSGSFSAPPKGLFVCQKCKETARAAEAMDEDRAKIEGLDIEEIALAAAQRLRSRRNISESVLRLAIRGEVVRQGSRLLAEKAQAMGDELLIRTWDEALLESLSEKSPNYEQVLSDKWHRFFASFTSGSRRRTQNSASHIRSILYTIALNGASAY